MQQLGRYEVLAQIAEGGMAVVYAGRLAEDPSRLVALKVIQSQLAHDPSFVAMFVDEAKITSRLVHRNIVRVHELGLEGEHPFLAMELVLGQTLADIQTAARERGVTIPHEVAAWIGARVAEGLHYAHDLGQGEIVHRDVNPANVVVTYEGRPKIIDFGLAHALDRTASTKQGMVKGKLAYLSPEQAQGHKVDRQTDVFALGISLWELTTGQRLFKAEDGVSTVRRILTTDAPDPSSVVADYPPALAAAVMGALAREKKDRWPTAKAFGDVLDAFVGGRVDERKVAELLAKLFPANRPRTPWEKAIETVARNVARRDGFLAWDDGAQKMTWFQLEGGAREPIGTTPADLRGLLERCAAADDAVTASRALVERAVAAELEGDAAGAAAHARAALEKDGRSTAAHWVLRRVRHDRARPGACIEHVDAELAAATTEQARADLHAERARLHAAAGAPLPQVIEDHERALALQADHPAALAGLDVAYAGAARARHLVRMAEAVSTEPALAAWLHVERARLLDASKDEAAAAGAMRAALALDPGLGPVRDACTHHAIVHRDQAALVDLLDSEALLQPDPARAAALECDAACIARLACGDDARALALLVRAKARDGRSPLMARRVADALVEVHEQKQDWPSARIARKARVLMHRGPAEQAYELRASAALAELAGDAAAVRVDLRLALAQHPGDVEATRALDRLLPDDDGERREALWVELAAHTADPATRADAFVRAADAAHARGRTAEAIDHLRGAVAADPEDPDLVERLATLLPGPRSDAAGEVGARLALYTRAADLAGDTQTRVAWLERIALLHEEVACDARLAAGTWAAVLEIEPGRRTAVLGLQRTSARAGDVAGHVAALLDEAKVVEEPRAARLRLRAARALAGADPARALKLAGDDAPGRALAAEIHARAGRWAEAARAIQARVDATEDGEIRARLLVALAEVQRTRLGAPAEALASLRAAHALAPDHPGLAEEIASLAAQRTDPALLRGVLAELAERAPSDAERARLYVRVAELDELALGDAAAAAETYGRAIEAVPGDAWVAARLARVAQATPKARTKKKKKEEEEERPVASLTDALAALDDGDAEAARGPLQALVAASPSSIPALRAVAEAAIALDAVPLWANTLESEIAALQAPAARLVALWTEAFLVEWRLPESGAFDLYERILELGADRAAFDGLARRALRAARDDDGARAAAVRALEGVLPDAPDASMRLAVLLELAGLLEARGDRKAALHRYEEALRADGRSPTAATGVARLADALGESASLIEGTCALAELVDNPPARATLLVRAAAMLATRAEEEPRARAADLLERALDTDPTSAPALGALASMLHDRERDRLMAALRRALSRTTRADAVLILATELAQVARSSPDDLPLALSALERARDAAPRHAPTWLALAEVHAAQSAWPEAVRAYEAAAEYATGHASRKQALVALADIHRRMGDRDLVMAVLRQICELDPCDVLAHRALVDALGAGPAGAPAQAEIARLLERLAEMDRTPETRAGAWRDLADVRLALGDRAGAEQAHACAVAESPTPDGLAHLAATYGAPPAGPSDLARVLDLVLAHGAAIGRPDGAVLGALALLEIDALGRIAQGVGHARAAIALAPGHHEARGALVRGLAQLGQHAEAVSVALPMFDDPESVLALARPDAFLDVLESSLHAAGRRQEALVVRELRALGGGVGDAAMVSLRARRLPDGLEVGPAALPQATIWHHVLPPEGRTILLELAGAVGAIASPFFPTEIEGHGALRGNVGAGHPLGLAFRRAAAALDVDGAELRVSEAVVVPRAVLQPGPIVIAPPGLATAPEPVQVAALARALTRIVLGVPWSDRARIENARAFLVAAARVVAPDFGSTPADGELETLVSEYAKPVAKATGRTRKKALAALEPDFDPKSGDCTRDDVAALVRSVGETEVRVAFLLTGDLLATLDDLRAGDGEYARAAHTPGPAALAATLRHPLAGQLVRFALGETATDLRRAAGTIWNQP